jgi:arylsulfatase A-like enzyme
MSQALLSKRWPWLVAASLVIVTYLFFTFVKVRLGDPRPIGTVEDIAKLKERDDLNVLFILIDTLRADRISAYGYERKTTPNLDLLAASGIRFDRHLAQSSWTKCSMASMWTALNPTRTGVTRFNDTVSDEANFPAEIFREAGFRTTALYRNGWVSPYFGFDQGFEVYDRPSSARVDPRLKAENPTVLGGGTDESAIEGAVEFLRIHGKERWLLYMHLMDVHEYLYDEASALFGTDYSSVYDNAIHWTDSVVGPFFSFMADEGYLENTLIVILSDHGEAFGERGLEGHARFVYKETTEVPLILSFPFRLDPGVVINTRTRNIDVWPTILELLGLPALGDDVDGVSRVPEIFAATRGEPLPEDMKPGFAQLDRHWGQRNQTAMQTVQVAEGPLRYVVVPSNKAGKSEELFDSSIDPAELRNLAAERPQDLERLRGLSEAYLAYDEAPWGERPDPLEMDEMQLNQLRALGYAIP